MALGQLPNVCIVKECPDNSGSETDNGDREEYLCQVLNYYSLCVVKHFPD